jgi:ABC-type uncharacterized transport system ATPase subunit
MLAFGPVSKIVNEMQPHRVLAVQVLANRDSAVSQIVEMPNVISATPVSEGDIRIEFSGDLEAQADFLAKLIQQGHRVATFREDSADLEDVFLKLTTGAVN